MRTERFSLSSKDIKCSGDTVTACPSSALLSVCAPGRKRTAEGSTTRLWDNEYQSRIVGALCCYELRKTRTSLALNGNKFVHNNADAMNCNTLLIPIRRSPSERMEAATCLGAEADKKGSAERESTENNWRVTEISPFLHAIAKQIFWFTFFLYLFRKTDVM